MQCTKLLISLSCTSVSLLLVEPSGHAHDDDEEETKRRREIWDVWKYCSERSKSVEVLYENLDGQKVLSKVHFRYDPAVSIIYFGVGQQSCYLRTYAVEHTTAAQYFRPLIKV